MKVGTRDLCSAALDRDLSAARWAQQARRQYPPRTRCNAGSTAASSWSTPRRPHARGRDLAEAVDGRSSGVSCRAGPRQASSAEPPRGNRLPGRPASVPPLVEFGSVSGGSEQATQGMIARIAEGPQPGFAWWLALEPSHRLIREEVDDEHLRRSHRALPAVCLGLPERRHHRLAASSATPAFGLSADLRPWAIEEVEQILKADDGRP